MVTTSQEEKSNNQPTIKLNDESADKVEHISDLIGSWGPLQKRLFLLLTLIYLAAPYNNASLFFYAIKSDIICVQTDGAEIVIAADKCSFGQLTSCSSWYHNITRTTITKEWNLVCENYWLRSLTLSAYQFGYLISGLLVGYISDKFGRKRAIAFSLVLEAVCSCGLILSPNVYLFAVIRVFHGIGGYGRFLASLILLMESVGPKFRGRIPACYEWVWLIGEYFMMIVTYNVMNFRYIYMGTLIHQLLSVIIVMAIPESARWQLVVGKIDKAKQTLQFYSSKATKGDNDKQFDSKFTKLRDYLAMEKKLKKSMGFVDLYRSPKISRFCFALYVIWFLQAFIGWGLVYSTLDLSGNVFINNAIILTASLVSNIFMTWKIDSYERRSMLIVMFLVTSILLFASMFVVESHQYIIPRMILIFAGKFSSFGIFIVLYVYTSEIFPTSIRHFGVGTCSLASRAASISAPFLAQLTAVTSLKLTFGLFALMGLIGALAATFLPETKGKEIPDTIEGMIKMHSVDSKVTKSPVI